MIKEENIYHEDVGIWLYVKYTWDDNNKAIVGIQAVNPIRSPAEISFSSIVVNQPYTFGTDAGNKDYVAFTVTYKLKNASDEGIRSCIITLYAPEARK